MYPAKHAFLVSINVPNIIWFGKKCCQSHFLNVARTAEGWGPSEIPPPCGPASNPFDFVWPNLGENFHEKFAMVGAWQVG